MNSYKALFTAFFLIATLLCACTTSPCENNADCGNGWLCNDGVCGAPSAGANGEESFAVPLECTTSLKGALVMNEFLANPQGTDVNGDGVVDPFSDEFVELLNLSNEAINMKGVSLQVGSHVRHVFEPRCLGPGQALVLFGGGHPVSTSAEYTLVSQQPLKLTNNGTSLLLLDPYDQILDSLIYDSLATDSGSFTRNPDGVGNWAVHPEPAKQRKVVHSAGKCSNFAVFPDCQLDTADDSERIDANECEVARAGEIIINEVMADPGAFDSNQDGELVWQHDEFVELIILADEARSLEGLLLTINGKTRAALPGECFPNGSALLIFGGGEPQISHERGLAILVSPKTLILPNIGGVVAITDGEDDIARFVYGPEGGKDQSMTRYPDGFGGVVLHQSTPGGMPASPGRCTNGLSVQRGQ